MCAWDKTKPENTSKIRNLGVEIRPNWEAIESADATFKPKGLNLDKNTVDSTAIADSMILYNKNNQLYAIDPTSVITKLSGGSLTAAATGKVVLPNGLTFIWGTGTASTAFVTKSFGLSGFSNNCFHISGSANGSTSTIGFAIVSKTQYKVKCDSGTPGYFYFAIGN